MNRWYFWVLAPVMLISAWIIGALTDPPTLFGRVLAYTISATLVAATIGLANPYRFIWAIRFVAGAILFGYVSYVGIQFRGWLGGDAFSGQAGSGGASLRNSLLGLLIIGLPAARVAFRRSPRTESGPGK